MNLKNEMEDMNWSRQAADKPLFPDLLWSRPQNRRQAGKLLIIGGHKQEFNNVSAAYAAAEKAGIGSVRIILPDSLAKMLSRLFPEAEYAASTPIGSFSRQAVGSLLDAAEWADGVLLAGDFGKNSETAVMLDGFVNKYQGMLCAAGDSIDYFSGGKSNITSREDTLLIANIKQLQKLAAPHIIRQTADLIIVLKQISSWASQADLSVVSVHAKQAIAAYKQQISTTPVKITEPGAVLSAYAVVWLIQQPAKPFEAITTANFCYQE